MRRILACVDLSEGTDAVIRCARCVAAGDGALVILHVGAPEPDFVGYDTGPNSVRDGVATELRTEHLAVQRLAENAREPGLEVTPLMVQGATVEKILEHAERLGVEFIVVGSAGHGWLHDVLLGSVVRGVLRGAKVPVVVVPARSV